MHFGNHWAHFGRIEVVKSSAWTFLSMLGVSDTPKRVYKTGVSDTPAQIILLNAKRHFVSFQDDGSGKLCIITPYYVNPKKLAHANGDLRSALPSQSS